MTPPFPRDLTFALLPVFLLLLIRGVRRGSKLYLVAAGAVLGGMGLAQGGEAFLVAALTAVIVILMTFRDGVPLRLASVLVPGIILYGIWAVPLMINYFRHGGFFDMSRSSLDFPLWSAIASWGIILPLGVYGVLRALPWTRTNKALTVLGAFLLSGLTGLIGSVVIEIVLGEGVGPLSRRHRYWPILCLAVALFAAVGATDLFERLRRRRRRTGVFFFAALIVLLAIPSPLLASLAYPDGVKLPVVITESLRDETHTLLNELDTRSGAVRTVGAIWLTDEIFAFTGHRLVAIVLGRELEENKARVRWRDIYEVTESLETRRADTMALIGGGENERQWQRLVDKYEVDAVIVPARLIDSPSFDGLAEVSVTWQSRTLYVVWIDTCQE
jgi:F0F1-type ATP synthase membrane subunit c/vacuolar-type H+-ATPase subunit K